MISPAQRHPHASECTQHCNPSRRIKQEDGRKLKHAGDVPQQVERKAQTACDVSSGAPAGTSYN